MKDFMKMLIPWINPYKTIYKLYLKAHKYYKKGNVLFAGYFSYKIYKKYNCYISPSAELDGEVILPHPIGIVIGDGVKIGKNVTIYQNVTLGRKNKEVAEYPNIKENVIIYCNSIVLGNVTINKNSIIGCNSTVLRDVEENSVNVGVIK